MSFPDLTHEVMTTCALRFDGWKFFQEQGDEGVFVTLTDRFVTTLQTSSNPNENHATFFALQRYLCKWGGEYLPESSREHSAFRYLFLHLYRVEIEPGFRCLEYWERWQARYAARADEYAAEARESILRDCSQGGGTHGGRKV